MAWAVVGGRGGGFGPACQRRVVLAGLAAERRRVCVEFIIWIVGTSIWRRQTGLPRHEIRQQSERGGVDERANSDRREADSARGELEHELVAIGGRL